MIKIKFLNPVERTDVREVSESKQGLGAASALLVAEKGSGADLPVTFCIHHQQELVTVELIKPAWR